MTRDEFCATFWRYYLMLESDYKETELFVEPNLGENCSYSTSSGNIHDFGNSRTYSLNFVKLLNVICAEVDAISRSICKELLGKHVDNMKGFAKEILKIWPDIVQQEVEYYYKILKPFEGWKATDKKSTPKWWSAYTSCKHGREENFQEANLKNVVNALAGLYILELYYVREIGTRRNERDVPNDKSAVFQLKEFGTKHKVLGYEIYCATNEDIDALFLK